ncbi:MAG: phosphate ABC transporter permease PstA [Oscillatoria sp. PMC 1051.18]|nr:phosphate ABC transporter permease PstA [Oscillatoria sp. PMC 1050.18]MEC5028283.1 phosphate ABC transporter permease PstA [Oscillatoria sp. PMC 1051.18]
MTERNQENNFKNNSMEYNNSRPRTWIGKLLTAIAFTLLGIALLPLGLVITYVIYKGASRFNLDLFTELPPAALQEGGGIANAIVGTLVLVGIAALIAIPIGVLAGIYLSEFSSRKVYGFISFMNNVLSGVPSIIMGVFAYGVIVLTTNTYSAYAGGFALAILMLPIVVRTTYEALQIVPQEVRWASAGVGASNFHTVLKIVLPAALPAILTGTTLAVARAAGETAPLLFTVLFTQFWPQDLIGPYPSLSVLIYRYATVPYQAQNELAWAASLILVLLILLTSIISRWATRKSIY